jgi:hypothetical protein
MDQLTIKLSGSIESTNFEEWKTGLIAQIQSTNRQLVTDDDFAEATKQVKALKIAEQSLKLAKQSAIDQAEEIQHLFSAIDDISGEARQARLSLERQVKARKLEIKNHHIQMGLDEIQAFIDEQPEEFKYIDLSCFVDRDRFESATSGKAGIKGLQKSIRNLCNEIKVEISKKALEITNNKVKLDALPEEHKVLFQDWKSLLSLPENEVDLEIQKRIALYNEEVSRTKLDKKEAELKRIKDLELNPELATTNNNNGQTEKYQIIIDLVCTKENAKEIARAVKDSFGEDNSIHGIKLMRNRND